MKKITLFDIAMAYRKVKVDLFYSGNPCRLAIAEFENDLQQNFQQIKDALEKNNQEYIFSCCKGYWLSPKKVGFSREASQKNLIFSNPQNEYGSDKLTECKLRLVANVPITFHIITTLWIILVGEKFDRKLSANSYGNRIRRCKDNNPNLNALGSFNPYLIHYQKWRDTGLQIMRNNLEAKKDVIAVTADFTSFYHNVSPDFLLNKALYNKLGIELNNDEWAFTQLIVEMLRRWARSTPLEKGLPVGCAISAVIANVVLAELDFAIEREVTPLYYGRYVDDIILVMENTNKFKSVEQVWNWIQQRVKCLTPDCKTDISKDSEVDIVFKSSFYLPNDLDKTRLFFEQSKTKVFLLEYPSGLGLLDSLEHQIKVRSSEWRALPELPVDSKIASMLLSACNKNGEDADNLRKADSLSIRRAMFAMKLRDFEAYCRNLDGKCWIAQRQAFLRTIDEYFTNIDSFFELFRYFPRIVAIATECNEYDLLYSLLCKINKICEIITNLSKNKSSKHITLEISGKIIDHSTWQKEIKLFQEYIFSGLRESFVSTYRFGDFASNNILQNIIRILKISNSLENKFDNLMGCDLAFLPQRSIYLYKEMTWSREEKIKKETSHLEVCPDFYNKKYFEILKEISCLNINGVECGKVPIAWIFPTRPFNITELYFICPNPFSNSNVFMNFLLISRGYAPNIVGMPHEKNEDSGKKLYHIQLNKSSDKKTIALVSWETKQKSWIAAACQKIDPDYTRYDRITHLLNQILHSRCKIDYVVFPELSIPPRWFLGLALKLKNSKISLVAGVEYIRKKNSSNVYNQVWCSLIHDGLGFNQSVIFKHDKDNPAIHEEQELRDVANVTLISETPNHTCDVVKHGDFYFGILICSELTNINYRAQLRGLVDAIFVPEWNSDIEMFSSLVEAAAYDVHAYIIQCNDRKYGDTRIRVPAKIHHQRDLVKIKGGNEDFFVIGEIDVKKLRKFQSFAVSPTNQNALFKPVPAGFKIATYRKILPEN